VEIHAVTSVWAFTSLSKLAYHLSPDYLMKTTISLAPQHLNQRLRVLALVINVLLAWTVFCFATDSFIPTGSGASVWFFAFSAYWLRLLIAAPFVSPPKDTLGLSIAAVSLLTTIDFSGVERFHDQLIRINYLAIIFSGFVLGASVIAMVRLSSESQRSSEIWYKISALFGQGEALLTFPITISALGFYQDSVGWAATILVIWIIQLVIHPVELFISILLHLLTNQKDNADTASVGKLMRIDDPNIVRVTLSKGNTTWKSEIRKLYTQQD
jgi:hypothetical protein